MEFRSVLFRSPMFLFFKQKTAYEIHCVTGVQTCALPIWIHEANRIAAAEVAVSRDDLKKAENQVALQVHTLYYGILIARLQKQAAQQQSTYARSEERRVGKECRSRGSPYH